MITYITRAAISEVGEKSTRYSSVTGNGETNATAGWIAQHSRVKRFSPGRVSPLIAVHADGRSVKRTGEVDKRVIEQTSVTHRLLLYWHAVGWRSVVATLSSRGKGFRFTGALHYVILFSSAVFGSISDNNNAAWPCVYKYNIFVALITDICYSLWFVLSFSSKRALEKFEMNQWVSICVLWM